MQRHFSGGRKTFRTLVRVMACMMPLLSVRASNATAITEHEVKAAYVVNILKLTERKTPLVGANTQDLVVCVHAAGPVDAPLRSLEGTVIRGRKLKLLSAKGDLKSCEAIVIGRTAGQEALLAKATAEGLLTVGMDETFLARNGMVALLVENRRVVVEINRVSVEGSDWRFSSHLLEIARFSNGGAR